MSKQKIDLSGAVEKRQEKVTSYLHNELEEASIEEILKGLIEGNGMMEIVACLDMIAQEHERRIILFSRNKGRVYPHPDVEDAPIVLKGKGGAKELPQDTTDSTCPQALAIQPMKPVDHVYKGGFFKNRHKLSWRAEIIGQALIDLFNLTPNSSVVDAGCAIGEYVNWLYVKGISAWGIEGSAAASEFMVTQNYSIWDLRRPIQGYGYPAPGALKYTIAISLEVAEHIEPEYAGVYLDNLCLLSDTILMTAAHPGQKGHGHVNCQEKEWWTCEMQKRYYKRDFTMERIWQESLRRWNHRKEVAVYAKNVMIFKKYH